MEKKAAVFSLGSILGALCLALVLAGSIWASPLPDQPQRRSKLVTNDLPTVTSFAKSTPEDTTLLFSQSDFADNFSAPEQAPLMEVRIESLTGNGTLSISGVAVTVDEEIPAANLDNLTFDPETNWSGKTSFEWNGSEDGESYADESAQVNITVIADNVQPTVTSFSKTTPKATPLKFATADFAANFNDDDGDELDGIQIIKLPTNGALQLSGENVKKDQEIDSEDIDALAFNPAPGWTGSTSFEWNGSDGDAYAETPALVNIFVTNRPPTVSSFSTTTLEDNALSFDLIDFAKNFNDPDQDPLNKIRIQSLPANGTLRLSGVAVIPNQEIAAANIGDLVFNPARELVRFNVFWLEWIRWPDLRHNTGAGQHHSYAG
jgi:hypothetical protein